MISSNEVWEKRLLEGLCFFLAFFSIVQSLQSDTTKNPDRPYVGLLSGETFYTGGRQTYFTTKGTFDRGVYADHPVIAGNILLPLNNSFTLTTQAGVTFNNTSAQMIPQESGSDESSKTLNLSTKLRYYFGRLAPVGFENPDRRDHLDFIATYSDLLSGKNNVVGHSGDSPEAVGAYSLDLQVNSNLILTSRISFLTFFTTSFVDSNSNQVATNIGSDTRYTSYYLAGELRYYLQN